VKNPNTRLVLVVVIVLLVEIVIDLDVDCPIDFRKLNGRQRDEK